MTGELTSRLAEFAHDLRLDDVPAAVIDKVKLHIVDQLGCQLAGATLPWSQIVERYAIARGAEGKATLVLSGVRRDAESAAMVNGTAGHAFEMDDYHQAPAHPGCVAVPAALAVAEEEGRAGAAFLLSVVLGFEIIVRIAEAAGPEAMSERGFHTSCTQGVFGSAVVTGKLMSLSRQQMIMALGIAGSHASGTVEYSQTGGDVKRYHAGLGAAGGIRSARLAAMGLTAPSSILEGRRGFLHAFSPSPRPERLTEKLGQEWRLMETCIKPYCCGGLIHAKIDALAQITDAHNIRADDVDQIVAGCDRLSLAMTGAIGPAPPDITAAQFSAHFALGLALVYGSNDFAAYQRALTGGTPDPDVVRIARKVRMELDDECESVFPRQYLAKITVSTRDGRRLQARAFAKGSPQDPIARSDVERKFAANASVALPEARAESILDTVHDVESLSNMTHLTRLLIRPAGTASS